MYQVDVMSRVPVYEQIVEQTKKFILSGILTAGDQIPTVRQLSASLSLNPNTVQKAFKELDRQGLIYSAPGKGCFITANARGILQQQKRGELAALEEQLRQLSMSGIKKEELYALIDQVYEKEKGEKKV